MAGKYELLFDFPGLEFNHVPGSYPSFRWGDISSESLRGAASETRRGNPHVLCSVLLLTDNTTHLTVTPFPTVTDMAQSGRAK